MLWSVVALLAAAAQTARNAMQKSLTAQLGTSGATQVRFLYGFPFALLFLTFVSLATKDTPAPATPLFLIYALAGALTQIIATALMLHAMKERSFSVTTAYTKTEPVQVALFGALVLGDRLTFPALLAILVATAGVIVMALRAGERLTAAGLRPAVEGIAAGGFFALSAICFRGGILALGDQNFVLRASTMLAWSLGIQTFILTTSLLIINRQALTASVRLWRSSLFAGFMGAFASQFWFIGFSLTAAANVRTLGLVEVIFAQVVTRRILKEPTSRRDLIGMALIVTGVTALMWVS